MTMWINPGSARDLVRARDQERQREMRRSGNSRNPQSPKRHLSI